MLIVKSFLIFSELDCSLQVSAQCACCSQDWITVSADIQSGLLRCWKPALWGLSQHFHSSLWISAGLTVFSNHSPKDGLVSLFSKLTLSVTGLFNGDFLLTVWEDWQIYYSGLSIMIFYQSSVLSYWLPFHLLTRWIVLTAITLICLNIIHECIFKSTLPLESIRTLRALLCLSLLTQQHCRGSIEGLEMHWKRWERESPSCWQWQPWVAEPPRQYCHRQLADVLSHELCKLQLA